MSAAAALAALVPVHATAQLAIDISAVDHKYELIRNDVSAANRRCNFSL
jgi:hypothetical protein